MLMDVFTLSLPAHAVLGFLSYTAGTAALFALFAYLYTRLAPGNPFALVREGNSAAAIALAGALLGFAIPVANAVSYSITLLDFLLWSVIAGAVQVLVFFVVSRVVNGLGECIRRQENAASILLAAVAIGIGMLNAASMTPTI